VLLINETEREGVVFMMIGGGSEPTLPPFCGGYRRRFGT
jgi:hypothetical protein